MRFWGCQWLLSESVVVGGSSHHMQVELTWACRNALAHTPQAKYLELVITPHRVEMTNYLPDIVHYCAWHVLPRFPWVAAIGILESRDKNSKQKESIFYTFKLGWPLDLEVIHSRGLIAIQLTARPRVGWNHGWSLVDLYSVFFPLFLFSRNFN